MLIPPLERLLRKDLPHRIIGLDPGGTTGFCLFEDGQLKHALEAQLGIEDIDKFLKRFLPIDHVCIEDYRVYAKYAQVHVSSSLPTVRLLGALTFWCHQQNTAYTLNMAGTAKGFVTNEKLRQWDLYQSRMKHSNDAIRHALYWMIFGDPHGRKYKPGQRVG